MVRSISSTSCSSKPNIISASYFCLSKFIPISKSFFFEFEVTYGKPSQRLMVCSTSLRNGRLCEFKPFSKELLFEAEVTYDPSSPRGALKLTDMPKYSLMCPAKSRPLRNACWWIIWHIGSEGWEELIERLWFRWLV
jgi:hypothetical protein